MYTQGNLLDLIDEGERRKQTGMDKAVDHANAVVESWFEKTYQASLRFISFHPLCYRFMTEELRSWLLERNLVEAPPSDRAWGAITVRLRRDGYIRSNGFAQVTNPKAHRTPASVWQIISKP